MTSPERHVVTLALVCMIAAGCSTGSRSAPERDGLLDEAVCSRPVESWAGLVAGSTDGDTGICTWKGIPYAAPPVGALRWRPPQPVEPWDGVLDATEWGAACIQDDGFLLINGNQTGYSEDCLFLNVWSPGGPGPYPVMVRIHGGACQGQTASIPMYDGGRLSRDGGVVVVTINYRVNVFGFFAHPALAREDPDGTTGNYGILDQVAALEWVRENIGAFGGDPENVTIFGESAGGWSVCTLLATPLATGLFHRAIMESGGCDATRTLEQDFVHGDQAAEALGCDADDLPCMREAGGERVLDALTPSLVDQMFHVGFDYIPHEDGFVLIGKPRTMIESGSYNRVPVMAGTNRDEFTIAMSLRPSMWLFSEGRYRARLRDAFGPLADEVLALYPPDPFGGPKRAFAAIQNERAMICPTYDGVRTLARETEPVYYYRFDYSGVTFGSWIGAFHWLEIPFIMGGFDTWPFIGLFGPWNRTEAEALSEVMQGYWTTFARWGDPNGPGRPEWRPFDPAAPTVQVLDVEVRAEPPGLDERCAFWREYNETHPPLWETGATSR